MLAKFSTHRTPTLRFSSPLTFQVSTDSHLSQGVPNFDHAMATTPMKRLRCCGTFHNFLSVCGILSKQWPPFLILKLPKPPRRASHIIFHRLHLCTEVGHGMATNPSKRDRYCGWKQRNEAEKVSAGSSKQRSSGPPCSSLCLHCP